MEVFLEFPQIYTKTLIILNKCNINPCFFHISLTIGFHEVSTAITMNRWLDDAKSFDAIYVFLYFSSPVFIRIA